MKIKDIFIRGERLSDYYVYLNENEVLCSCYKFL